ncbi:hypothetical protein Q7O_000954 [Pectobacterium carotovorum subsp. carotovorum PCCS1]|nr:hypothetical protein [Pectobacterium carotovorum subsp. carotovorum PCCS1]
MKFFAQHVFLITNEISSGEILRGNKISSSKIIMKKIIK